MCICQEDCAQTILNKSTAGEVLNRISKLSLCCWRFYDRADPPKKSLLFECQKNFTLITNKLLFFKGVGGSDIEGNSCTIVNVSVSVYFHLVSSRLLSSPTALESRTTLPAQRQTAGREGWQLDCRCSAAFSSWKDTYFPRRSVLIQNRAIKRVKIKLIFIWHKYDFRQISRCWFLTSLDARIGYVCHHRIKVKRCRAFK